MTLAYLVFFCFLSLSHTVGKTGPVKVLNVSSILLRIKIFFKLVMAKTLHLLFCVYFKWSGSLFRNNKL